MTTDASATDGERALTKKVGRSIRRAMGLLDIETVGDADLCAGPLL